MTRAESPRVGSIDQRAAAFINRQRLAHLATVDASGGPHVVPICFALVGETLYMPIDEKPKRGSPHTLRRLHNIAANPNVSVVFDVYNDADWSQLGFVLVRALARVLHQPNEQHARALAVLRERYVQYRSMALEERPVVAMDITAVTTWGALT